MSVEQKIIITSILLIPTVFILFVNMQVLYRRRHNSIENYVSLIPFASGILAAIVIYSFWRTPLALLALFLDVSVWEIIYYEIKEKLKR